MSTVQEIEAAIKKLSSKEFEKLLEWIGNYMDDDWDRQIKKDAKAGRLQFLINQAEADVAHGKTKPFP